MSNNRIKTPGQVDIECTSIPAPSAFPLYMTLNTPTGPKLIAWGGLSKLEWMSGMVASCAGWEKTHLVVDIAQQILDECERRQNGTQKGNGQIEAAK